MNISTKSVLVHMNEQMKRLEMAALQDNREVVQESIAAIEAYCRLFKGEEGEHAPSGVPKQKIGTQSTYPEMPQPLPSAGGTLFHEQTESATRTIKKGSENLLDF